MSTQSWFAFKNAADDKSVEISIYDVIGSYDVSAKSFIAELKQAGTKDIELRIHSPGGNILEGNAIYNALDRYAGAIHVVIDGIAASMASVIAMAGDTVEIAENGLIMIHNPNAYSGGDARDLRKMADVMDKLKANIVTAYAKKSGLSREKIGQMMDDETWMDAAEALENKFVDLIGDKSTAENTFDLSSFRNWSRVVDTFSATNSMDLKASAAKILELENAATLWEAVKTGLEKAKADAEAKIVALDADKLKLTNDLTAANGKVTGLEGEKVELTNQLATANADVTKLKGEAKSSDEKAREQSASMGVTATAKSDDGKPGSASADGKAIYEAYDQLMTAGKSAEASAYWAKHEKELTAYAEQLTKERD